MELVLVVSNAHGKNVSRLNDKRNTFMSSHICKEKSINDNDITTWKLWLLKKKSGYWKLYKYYPIVILSSMEEEFDFIF